MQTYSLRNTSGRAFRIQRDELEILFEAWRVRGATSLSRCVYTGFRLATKTFFFDEAPDAGEGVVDQGSFKAELLVVLHALGVSDVASLRLHTEIRDGVVVTEVRGPANAVAEVRRLPRIEVMGRTVTQRSRERLGAAEDGKHVDTRGTIVNTFATLCWFHFFFE